VSQENVELVRRGIQDVHVFWGMLDEQVLMDSRNFPAFTVEGGGVVVGREAVMDGTRRYWGTWEDYSLDAEELIDAGASVVGFVRERGRGKGSGAPVERRWAQVWTFRRGRIIRWELFEDKAAALEAAGLPE
jgi:ketosteroid isomerase-like protein